MQLPTLAESDRELDPGPLQMDVERDERQSLLIHLSTPLVDFTSVGQKFAGPERIVVKKTAGVAVGRDVHVVQLQFAVADQTEAIPQVGLSSSD